MAAEAIFHLMAMIAGVTFLGLQADSAGPLNAISAASTRPLALKDVGVNVATSVVSRAVWPVLSASVAEEQRRFYLRQRLCQQHSGRWNRGSERHSASEDGGGKGGLRRRCSSPWTQRRLSRAPIRGGCALRSRRRGLLPSSSTPLPASTPGVSRTPWPWSMAKRLSEHIHLPLRGWCCPGSSPTTPLTRRPLGSGAFSRLAPRSICTGVSARHLYDRQKEGCRRVYFASPSGHCHGRPSSTWKGLAAPGTAASSLRPGRRISGLPVGFGIDGYRLSPAFVQRCLARVGPSFIVSPLCPRQPSAWHASRGWVSADVDSEHVAAVESCGRPAPGVKRGTADSAFLLPLWARRSSGRVVLR